jgi:hypothetical protein
MEKVCQVQRVLCPRLHAVNAVPLLLQECEHPDVATTAAALAAALATRYGCSAWPRWWRLGRPRLRQQLGSCCVAVLDLDVSGSMGLGHPRSVSGWRAALLGR